jgi:hypothetical protein
MSRADMLVELRDGRLRSGPLLSSPGLAGGQSADLKEPSRHTDEPDEAFVRRRTALLGTGRSK